MSSYKILTFSGSDPALRPYKHMIYSDFMRTLRYGNDWYELIDSESYYKTYEQVIDRILERSDTLVRLACLTDDLDVCLGWSLAEGSKLHYIYVKRDLRKRGIATTLLPSYFDQITHLTKIGQSIRKSKFPKVVFNPF